MMAICMEILKLLRGQVFNPWSNLLQKVITGLLAAALMYGAVSAGATESVVINATDRAPLFDGRCGEAEWQSATKIELPAEVWVYLMHDDESLYACARGKKEDYTVIDLYIQHAGTGHLYNLHASAQLKERELTEETWNDPEHWNNEGWSGFWVPFAGIEETEEGERTQFLKGSDRELQVLRSKFPGDRWKMMIGISAVYQEGAYGAEFSYPEGASDTDASTWLIYSFSR